MSISPERRRAVALLQPPAPEPQGLAGAGGGRGRATRLPAGIGGRIERLGPQLKESIKAFWAPGLFFEELDLAYVGVIDGHDVKALRRALSQALGADRPVVVHIKTVKGKGFAPAEEGGLEGMEKWHAAKPGSVKNGRSPRAPRRCRRPAHGANRRRSTRRCSARRWWTEARRDPRVIGITAAMAGGTGLSQLAARAARPVLRRRHRRAARGAVRGRARARGDEAGRAIYSTFLQRALRPDHPRRLPAAPRRRVLHGPRGPRRRRRPDAPRRLRHLVPARDPEHGRDGAA